MSLVVSEISLLFLLQSFFLKKHPWNKCIANETAAGEGGSFLKLWEAPSEILSFLENV